MINFFLGFFIVDFLFSLILFFRKNVILNLNRNYLILSMIVDLIFIGVILYLKKNAQRKKVEKP